jgi:hypothetical protein
MRIKPLAALLLIALIVLIAAAPPAEAMRCGSRLVSEGDPRDKVLADCGPPSGAEAWDEEQYEYFGRPPDPRQYREFERYGSAYRVRAVVRVEVWTYNYGPSRFVDYVRFENGRVRRIESGGYGY